MMTQQTVTPGNPRGRRRQASSAGSRGLRLFLSAVAVVLLLVATFFVARHVGTERGQQAAREEIERQNDLTAGPESLI